MAAPPGRNARALQHRVRNRNRGEEGTGVRVSRPAIELTSRRHLDDLAQVHHRDPVGDVLNDRQVVRDEEIGQVELGLQALEQVDDLGLDRDVEGRNWLVANDEGGVDRQRAGDADPLSLASRELMGVAVGEPRVHPDDVKQLVDPVLPLFPLGQLEDVDRLADDVAHRLARVERRVRILEDHGHLAPPGAQPFASLLGDVFAFEMDRAGRGFEQPDQGSTKGRFAASRLADEPDRLTFHDVEVDSIDRMHVSHRALQHARGNRKPHLQAAH